MLKNLAKYSLAKYIELGSVAIILLHFANIVGPDIYGETATSLLIVTYSSFFVLGINGAYVKYYSKENNRSVRILYSSFNFYYNTFMSVILLGLILFFLKYEYAYLIAIISALNIIKGSIQSILRACLKINHLSLLNLLFGISFSCIYIYMYMSSLKYDNLILFTSWAYSLSLTIVFGLCAILKLKLLYRASRKRLICFLYKGSNKIVKSGFKIALLTLASISILTSDRIVMINYGIEKHIVGLYQYADNISNVFYLAMSTFLYLLTPIYINKLHNNEIGIKQFMHKFLRYAFMGFITVILFCIIAYYFIVYVTPVYTDAFLTILLLSLVKYFVIVMFIPNTIFFLKDCEKDMLKIYFVIIPVMIASQIIIALYYAENTLIYMPLSSMISVLIVFILSLSVAYNYDSEPIDNK